MQVGAKKEDVLQQKKVAVTAAVLKLVPIHEQLAAVAANLGIQSPAQREIQ